MANKEYLIYTSKVAFELRKRGFNIIRTGINKHHPQFDTYYFKDTPEFRAALESITDK